MKKTTKDNPRFILELIISGDSFISNRVIKSIKRLCENELKNNYKLTVIDLKENPEYVLKENILAVPLLIRLKPLPKRQIIGDLQDYQRILKGLDIG